MKTQTGRLVIAMAMLWIAFGADGRAEAGGLALTTPAGLSPGESFRFVFVTTDGTTALSSQISYYDNFVNSEADGATYNGRTITWQAIGSTASVNAIDHIGVNPSISGVYLVTGTQVASGDGTATGGLWSGSLIFPIDAEINSVGNATEVWTGTYQTGQVYSTNPLGAGGLGSPSGSTVWGLSNATVTGWVNDNTSSNTDILNLYGISGVLVVPTPATVPEPSSLILAGLASSIGLGLAWARSRKEQGRQGPAGPTDER